MSGDETEVAEALRRMHDAGLCPLSHNLAIMPPPAPVRAQALDDIANRVVLEPTPSLGTRWRLQLGWRELCAYARLFGVELATYRGRADARA